MSNVVPLRKEQSIQASLRDLADRIEAGEYGELTYAVVAFDADDAISTQLFGWPADEYSPIGLLEIAKHTILGDLIG